MNHGRIVATVLALAVLVLAAPGLAQANSLPLPDQPQEPIGTGFTYQGYLEDGGAPAEGAYDFEFSLYDVDTDGVALGTLTLDDVPVTGGYFSVLLDFGAAVFNGEARWLEIGVRPGIETGAYTTLEPRQALTAAPYASYAASAGMADLANSAVTAVTASYAGGAPWTGLSGVPAGFADGVDDDTNTTYTAGSGLALAGTEFSVTGAPWTGITGLPAGFDDDVDNDTTYTAGSGLSLTGTEFSVTGAPWGGLTDIPAGFADGVDDVTNITYTAGTGLSLTGTEFSVNFGGSGTAVTASHSDHDHANFWSIAGNSGTDPATNFLGTTDNVALVFRVNGLQALRLEPNATSPNLIGGYLGNSVTAGAYGATIGGGGASGFPNQVTGNYGSVGGGYRNTAASGATVAGGVYNTASGVASTVSGGGSNTASGQYSVIGGGSYNNATAINATVGGGYWNLASGGSATVAGGHGSTASGYDSTVGGGVNNSASGDYSTVGGGAHNDASSLYSTVGGGYWNSASGFLSAVGGGMGNWASGNYSTVPGGTGAVASHYGQMAYTSGCFSNGGDAQASLYVLRDVSTGTAWADLYLGGDSALLTLATDQVVTFDIMIVGTTDAGESAGYRIQGVIENIGGDTFFVGTPIVTVLGEDDAAWDVQVLADDTNDALLIQAMGNNETIRWVATVQTAEVSWP